MEKKLPPDQYLWIEEKNDDFPFYNNKPIHVSEKRWLAIIGFAFVGFLLLSFLYIPFIPPIFITIIATFCLPIFSLLGLKIFIGNYWHTLFRPLYLKDIVNILLFTILSLITSAALSGLATLLTTMNNNPDSITDTGKRAVEFFWFSRIQDVVQLFGEEFLAILPFLFLLQWFTQKRKLSRKQSIIYALILSSILFGLLHLPTYNWNIWQCILVIGLGRIVDSLAYIRTKNLWVSYLVHFLYDTLLFSLSFIGG